MLNKKKEKYKEEYVHLTSSPSFKKHVELVVVLSILILHYNMYYFHFTLQEPC